MRSHETIVYVWAATSGRPGHVALSMPYKESFVYVSFYPREAKKIGFFSIYESEFHLYAIEPEERQDNRDGICDSRVVFLGLNVRAMQKALEQLCRIKKINPERIMMPGVGSDFNRVYEYLPEDSSTLKWTLLSGCYRSPDSFDFNCVQIVKHLLRAGGIEGYFVGNDLRYYNILCQQLPFLKSNCLMKIDEIRLSHSAAHDCENIFYDSFVSVFLSKIHFSLFDSARSVLSAEFFLESSGLLAIAVFDLIRIYSQRSFFSMPRYLVHDVVSVLAEIVGCRNQAIILIGGYVLPGGLSFFSGFVSGISLREQGVSAAGDLAEKISQCIRVVIIFLLVGSVHDFIDIFQTLQRTEYLSFFHESESWLGTISGTAYNGLNNFSRLVASVMAVERLCNLLFVTVTSLLGRYHGKIYAFAGLTSVLQAQTPFQLERELKAKAVVESRVAGSNFFPPPRHGQARWSSISSQFFDEAILYISTPILMFCYLFLLKKILFQEELLPEVDFSNVKGAFFR